MLDYSPDWESEACCDCGDVIPTGSVMQEPADQNNWIDIIDRILISLSTAFLLLTIAAQCCILMNR